MAVKPLLTAATREAQRRHARADELLYAIRRLLYGLTWLDDVKHAKAVGMIETALASEARRAVYRRQREKRASAKK